MACDGQALGTPASSLKSLLRARWCPQVMGEGQTAPTQVLEGLPPSAPQGHLRDTPLGVPAAPPDHSRWGSAMPPPTPPHLVGAGVQPGTLLGGPPSTWQALFTAPRGLRLLWCPAGLRTQNTRFLASAFENMLTSLEE